MYADPKSLDEYQDEKVYSLNVETTGTDGDYDEMLRLTVYGCGGVVYDSYFKPEHVTDWREAEAINGITKTKVENAPHAIEEASKIHEILAEDGAMFVVFKPDFVQWCLSTIGLDASKYRWLPLADVYEARVFDDGGDLDKRATFKICVDDLLFEKVDTRDHLKKADQLRRCYYKYMQYAGRGPKKKKKSWWRV